METEIKFVMNVEQHNLRPHDPIPRYVLPPDGPDLFHLDPDVECFRQNLDQFSEIHAVIGDVVENGFCLVPLVLHVPDLHVKSEFGSDNT